MNQIVIRGGCRTAATSKMEHFVIIVNGWKPLTIITKSSILDVAAVLDPPLVIVRKIHHQRTQILTMDHLNLHLHLKTHQNLQRKKCPRISIPHQGSLPSLQRKMNKWKFSKQLKKWAKAEFLKHIYDQEIKDSILENNPVSSNFFSRQKLNDYWLEILSEAGKKDEIFSDRSPMKKQENLANIMGPLGLLWEINNEGVIDLNKLLELIHQFVILV